MHNDDWNDDDRRRGSMRGYGQSGAPGRGGWEDDSWRTGAQREPRGGWDDDRGMRGGRGYGGRSDRGDYGARGGYGGYGGGWGDDRSMSGGRGYGAYGDFGGGRGDYGGGRGNFGGGRGEYGGGYGERGGYDEGWQSGPGRGGPMGAGGYRGSWDDDRGYAGEYGGDYQRRSYGGGRGGGHASGYYGAQGSSQDYGGRYSGSAGRGDYGGGYGLGQNYDRRYDDQDGFGMQGHRGRGPKGYTRSDDRIREDVSDRLSDDPSVDASDIEVSVSNGEVTLSGTVDSRQAKRRAEDCADEVSGVDHVQNNLRVAKSGSSRGSSEKGREARQSTGSAS